MDDVAHKKTVLTEEQPRESKRGRTSKLQNLPAEVYDRMLQLIKLGATDRAAAASIGVRPETFYVWLRKGKQAKSGKYRVFYDDVMQARAHAQVTAELEVKRKNPEFWLARGPAKHDWSQKQEIDIHQQLEVEASRIESRRPAPLASLGKAFAILHELGISHDSEERQRLIEQEQEPSNVLDAESQPVPKENTGGETEGQNA